MVVCQVCKEKEAEQEHHISYYPELKIDVCIDCHKIIHNHGVGSPIRHDHEIVEDSPTGTRIPLTSTGLRLTYKCIDCGERFFIAQSLINLLLFRKPLAEPRIKCSNCNVKPDYDLILEESWIVAKCEHNSYYVSLKGEKENG